MQQVYVKPRLDEAGAPVLIRQPDRQWAPLPIEGRWVALDEYWTRRLRDGDVVEAVPPAEPAPAAESPSANPPPAKPARAARG